MTIMKLIDEGEIYTVNGMLILYIVFYLTGSSIPLPLFKKKKKKKGRYDASSEGGCQNIPLTQPQMTSPLHLCVINRFPIKMHYCS